MPALQMKTFRLLPKDQAILAALAERWDLSEQQVVISLLRLSQGLAALSVDLGDYEGVYER